MAEQMNQSTEKGTAALGSLATAVQALTGAMSAATSSVSSAGGMLQGLGGAIGGAASMLGSVLGPAGKAAGEALGSVVSKVGEFINAIQPFVAALAPGTILLFQQALENLQATVGVAFEPIFQVLTALFQRIGGLILPVMEALRPVIQQVSESFSNLMLPLINLMVSQFMNLLPFIQNMGQLISNVVQQLMPFIALFNLLMIPINLLMQALALLSKPFLILGELMGVLSAGIAEAVDAVQIVFKALVDAFKSMIPSMDIKDLFKSLASVITKVIAQYLIFVGMMMKFWGMDTALKKLIEGLEPKAGQVAAPKNAAIGSVESLAKDIATAAATASGTADTEKEQSFADVVKELKNIQSGGDSKFTQVIGRLDSLIKLLGGGKSKAAEDLGYDSNTEALADVFGVVMGNPRAILSVGGRLARKARGR